MRQRLGVYTSDSPATSLSLLLSLITSQLHLDHQQWYERERWRWMRQEGERAAGKRVMEQGRASVRLYLVGGYPNWVTYWEFPSTRSRELYTIFPLAPGRR